MKKLIKSRCNKIYEIGVELREIKGKLEKFSSILFSFVLCYIFSMIENPPVVKSLSRSAISILINPRCRELIEDINREYLYWDKVKYKVPAGLDKTDFWAAVKFSRQGKILNFAGKSFTFNETGSMQQMLHEFDLNFGGTLLSLESIPERRREYYLLSSIAEEAIASSKMEGAVTTREIAKEMIRTQAKPKDKSQRMILNNYETIEYLRKNRNTVLSKDFILEIHKRITQGTLDNREDEGRFRDDNKIVVADSISGDIVHFPPDCSCIENGIEMICSFANNEGEGFIHPIIKAVIIHFMLSFLHPFVDGNGRTARSLFYWYMLREGYWLTEFLAISRNIYKTKGQYEKAFIHTELDDGDLGYFIQYNLIALKKSFSDLKDYLQRKQKEESELLEFRKIDGINERQAGIIKIYADKPNSVFTAKELVNSFGVTEKTVRADLEGLVVSGFLERVAKNKRLFGYAASPDFNFKLAGIKGK